MGEIVERDGAVFLLLGIKFRSESFIKVLHYFIVVGVDQID